MSHITMKTALKFKTTINCSGCIAAVTPSLNRLAGEGHWQVDVTNPDKILAVEQGTATEAEIVETVKKAGYQITPLNTNS